MYYGSESISTLSSTTVAVYVIGQLTIIQVVYDDDVIVKKGNALSKVPVVPAVGISAILVG